MGLGRWFYLVQNEVKGPFSREDIDSHLRANPTALVWGPGLVEWVTESEWREKISLLDLVLDSLKTDHTPSWWFKDGLDIRGPLTYQNLIRELKLHPMAGDLDIRQDPETEYKLIYDFPALVDEVGVSRRKHERVPLSGVLIFTKNNQKLETLITTISVGGVGVQHSPFFTVGDHLRGEIKSPLLSTEIFCEVEVLSQHRDGNWGLRFVQLPYEFQTVIVSYIKKFSTLA